MEDEEEDDDEELVDEDGSVYRPAKRQKLNDSAGLDASRISNKGPLAAAIWAKTLPFFIVVTSGGHGHAVAVSPSTP